MKTLKNFYYFSPLPRVTHGPIPEAGWRRTALHLGLYTFLIFNVFSNVYRRFYIGNSNKNFYSFFFSAPYTRGGFRTDRHAADRNWLGGLKFPWLNIRERYDTCKHNPMNTHSDLLLWVPTNDWAARLRDSQSYYICLIVDETASATENIASLNPEINLRKWEHSYQIKNLNRLVRFHHKKFNMFSSQFQSKTWDVDVSRGRGFLLCLVTKVCRPR